ncbi:MAG: histidine kinase N-terminal 7TM domain-containing protein [Deferribacterales bacterium]
MYQFQLPPFAIINLLTAVYALALGIYTFVKIKDKAFYYFGAVFIIGFLWSLYYFIELTVADVTISHEMAKYRHVFLQVVPFFMICAIHLLVKRKMPPKWISILLFVFGIYQIILQILFSGSTMVWDIYETAVTSDGYVLTRLEPGIWMKVNYIIFQNLPYLYGIYILISGMKSSKKSYREQCGIFAVSIILCLIFLVVYKFHLKDFGYYNPTAFVFIMLSIGYTSVVYQKSIFISVPYVKESVFDIIQLAVMIVDEEEKLIDCNTQAKNLFRVTDKDFQSDIRDVFGRLNICWESITVEKPASITVAVENNEKRIFSVLKKEVQHKISGYVLVFTDVTDQYALINAAHAREIVTYKESLLGDMHDGIGGVMATAAMLSQSAHDEDDMDEKNIKLERIVRLLENGSHELRSMLNLLDKDDISWASLVSDMREFSSTVLEAKGIQKKFLVVGSPFDNEVNFDRYVNMFRLFKEAVTNVVKHSDATVAEITVVFSGDSLRITVSDNGIGIDFSKQKGYGINNMQKRAKKLGGTCDISSENGTVVEIAVKIL